MLTLPSLVVRSGGGARREGEGLAADLPHEANAGSTFSLSGSLSSDNKCSRPDALSTFVRINKNKPTYKPAPDETLKVYRSKFGKVTHHVMYA